MDLRPRPFPFRNTFTRAFGLLEVLVVVSIVCVLISASLPAFTSIVGSRSVDSRAHEIAGLLEYARTEAIARQTYVWVGLQTIEIEGRYQTIAGAVYSRDGTGTNTASSNLAPLARLIQFPHMQLIPRSDLKERTRDLFVHSTVSLEQNTEGISFDLGAGQFRACTLTFTPGGGVLLKGGVSPDDGYDTFIDVGLRQTKGTNVPLNAQEAALLVDGSNGTVKVLRYQ